MRTNAAVYLTNDFCARARRYTYSICNFKRNFAKMYVGILLNYIKVIYIIHIYTLNYLIVSE